MTLEIEWVGGVYSRPISVAITILLALGMMLTGLASAGTIADDGSVLPFPPPPSESVAKPRLQDSIMQWPKEPGRLPKDAPNILIVLIDDVGFGIADTFGGTRNPMVVSWPKGIKADDTLRYWRYLLLSGEEIK